MQCKHPVLTDSKHQLSPSHLVTSCFRTVHLWLGHTTRSSLPFLPAPAGILVNLDQKSKWPVPSGPRTGYLASWNSLPTVPTRPRVGLIVVRTTTTWTFNRPSQHPTYSCMRQSQMPTPGSYMSCRATIYVMQCSQQFSTT